MAAKPPGIRHFDLTPGTRLRLQSRSGRVHVIAEPRADVEAESDALEWRSDDDALSIRSSRGGTKTLTVRCPIGCDISIGTQSGSVRLQGKLAAVSVTTMSGSIEADEVDEADLRTMSGKIAVGACHARCRLSAVSGDITGGDIESAYIQTISGSIEVKRLRGDVRARSVSGSITIGSLADGNIAVKTVSGSVRINIPEGTEPRVLIKTRGRVKCDCPQGDDMRIEAASTSGSVEVVA